MLKHIDVKTNSRTEMIDITSKIQNIINETDIKDGICYLYVPHTTAAITINEGADPSVKKDILQSLNNLIPQDAGYSHIEGNADSHIKTTLINPCIFVFIKEGKLQIGRWQSIFFCEFDGPRQREVIVKIVKDYT